eukprot:15328786-Alexandrium_andersonii.AAC.1
MLPPDVSCVVLLYPALACTMLALASCVHLIYRVRFCLLHSVVSCRVRCILRRSLADVVASA